MSVDQPWMQNILPQTNGHGGSPSAAAAAFYSTNLIVHGVGGAAALAAAAQQQPLKCAECGLVKHGVDELESHVKMEHLNWLPFQCYICGAERAMESEMREHMYSRHGKNTNKFLFTDNPNAKRALQIFMDRVRFNAHRAIAPAPTVNSNQALSIFSPPRPQLLASFGSPQHYGPEIHALSPDSEERNSTPLRINGTTGSINNGSVTRRGDVSDEIESYAAAARRFERRADHGNISNFEETVFASSRPSVVQQTVRMRSSTRPSPIRNSPAASSVSSISQNPASRNINGIIPAIRPEVDNHEDDDTPVQSSLIAAANAMRVQRIKSEFTTPASRSLVMQEYDNYEEPNDYPTTNQNRRFSNVDSSPVVDVRLARNASRAVNSANHYEEEADEPLPHQSNRFRLNAAKINPLADIDGSRCSKCAKTITKSSRTMHMYYHLAKDYNCFRFVCTVAGCKAKNYRRDLLTLHQSREHGRIMQDFIRDRSNELYETVRELSCELLGSELTDAPQQNSQSAAPRTSSQESLKRHQPATTSVSSAVSRRSLHKQQAPVPIRQQFRDDFDQESLPYIPQPTASRSRSVKRPAKDHLHNIVCRLCNKTMRNKVRSLHVLWHLAHDRGINRYRCRFCSYGHDRTESVKNHGRREHNNEDCLEDLIEHYANEVRTVSMECFNCETIFSSDPSRRSGPKRRSAPNTNPTGNYVAEDYDDPDTSMPVSTSSIPEQGRTNLFAFNAARIKKRQSAPGSSSKSSTTRRMPSGYSRKFGTRRPLTKHRLRDTIKLREISLKLGAARYMRKNKLDALTCGVCLQRTPGRLSEHVYRHINQNLFLCPLCDLGGSCRDSLVKHLREFHPGSNEIPIDDRFKFASVIKHSVVQCFPTLFIDAPLPDAAEFEGVEGVNIEGAQDRTMDDEEEEDEPEENQDGMDRTESISPRDQAMEDGALDAAVTPTDDPNESMAS